MTPCDFVHSWPAAVAFWLSLITTLLCCGCAEGLGDRGGGEAPDAAADPAPSPRDGGALEAGAEDVQVIVIVLDGALPDDVSPPQGRCDDAPEAPACGRAFGVCVGASQICEADGRWRDCESLDYIAHDPRYTPDEGDAHCDGLDNDCDGQVDEGCDCLEGEALPCGTEVGECRVGAQLCVGGQWGDCDGVTPVEEACDGRDNDCDGEIDEGCECIDGARRVCGSDTGECISGESLCAAGRWGACGDRGPSPEACNGLDDDCDGAVDEEAPCGGDHACQGGACRRVRWVFQAESGAFGHDVGRADGDGWAAWTDQDGRGFLTYGPYTRDIPAGRYVARFRLMIDDHTANNDHVARIEINDYDQRPECGDCILARTHLRRGVFNASLRYQDFSLSFDNPGGRRLEFRVYWEDTAYIRQDSVSVEPAG